MERTRRAPLPAVAAVLATLIGGCAGGAATDDLTTATGRSSAGDTAAAASSTQAPSTTPTQDGAQQTARQQTPTRETATQVLETTPSDSVLTPKEVYAENANAVVRILTGDGGSGSGFVIDIAEGLVVTNAHVTGGVGSLSVVTSRGDRVPARRLGVSPCEDLAVLQMNTVPHGVTQVVMGDSSALQPQDEVTAIGFPASFEATTDGSRTAVPTSGHVQVPRLDAAPHSSLPIYYEAVQHDAVINPGNSGGPLFNDRGEVVGVNSLANTQQGGRTIQGQYYAISTEHAMPVIEQLKNGVSYSDVGFTGFDFSILTPEKAAEIWENGGGHPAAFAEAELPALVVSEVEVGSPAEAAQIYVWDVITRMAGQPVSSFAQVCDVLASTNPGDTIMVDGVYMEPTGTRDVYDTWRVELKVGDASGPG